MNDTSDPGLTLSPRSDQPREEWLLVDAVELLWLLPRREAVHLSELTATEAALPACGQVRLHDQAYAAVYWNRKLRLCLPEEGACRSALIVQSPGGALALACHRLMRLERTPRFYTLPQCMRGRHHAFEQVAVIDGRVAAKVNTELLLRQLPEALRRNIHSQQSSLGG
ncbi:hypothetical protein [Marinimicrobium agarilyticum]|uniref:hypothetical protein n=1 Tax=Marinimicrobium agarilyticum TaxID=306546 RepID=UPI00040F5211|nr:hypothetical protein [Marinimicrobium agarilyticum]